MWMMKDCKKTPASWMRDQRTLIGSEGPKDNVLKIRWPLAIDVEGSGMITAVLGQVLGKL